MTYEFIRSIFPPLSQVVIQGSDDIASRAIDLLKEIYTNLGPKLQVNQVDWSLCFSRSIPFFCLGYFVSSFFFFSTSDLLPPKYNYLKSFDVVNCVS